MELTHTRLLVDKYKESYHFYKNILGFECTWGDENSNYAQFKTGATQLAIFDKKQMMEDISVAYPLVSESLYEVVLIFRVDNVNEKYEALNSKIHFLTEPHDRIDWGIRVAHFRDPNGTLIEINENI